VTDGQTPHAGNSRAMHSIAPQTRQAAIKFPRTDETSCSIKHSLQFVCHVGYFGAPASTVLQ